MTIIQSVIRLDTDAFFAERARHAETQAEVDFCDALIDEQNGTIEMLEQEREEHIDMIQRLSAALRSMQQHAAACNYNDLLEEADELVADWEFISDEWETS